MDFWYDGAVYSKKYEFGFGDCDKYMHVSLYTIMKLFSEITGEDFAGRGLGRYELMERKQVFLLSRMSIQIHRRPFYEEKVILITWARDVAGPYCYRDFEIKTETGELLVSSTTVWCIVNPFTRAVLRTTDFGEFPEMNSRRSACPECRKLRKNMKLPLIGGRPVYFSDIDNNGHINNAVYGEIAIDFLPKEYQKREFTSVFINFNSETRQGETMEVRGGENAEGFEIQGLVGDGLRFSTQFVFGD